MPAPYSMDLRRRIVSSYEQCEGTVEQIATRFKVSVQTVVNYLQRKQETGDIRPTGYIPGKKTIIDKKGCSAIREWVNSNPDIILSELCKKYAKRFKVKVSLSMMCRALQQMNLRRKKKSAYALEQDREDVKKKRGLQADDISARS